MNLDRYLSPVRVLPYSTSRGCYWKKCAFCPETAEDAPYLTGTPQAMVDDLRQAAAQTSAGLVHFLDNALSPRLLGYLIEPSARRALVWIRPGHPAPHRPRLCQRAESIRMCHAQAGGGIRGSGCAGCPWQRHPYRCRIPCAGHHSPGGHRHIRVSALRHTGGERAQRRAGRWNLPLPMHRPSIFSIWPSSIFPPTATRPVAWIRWISMKATFPCIGSLSIPRAGAGTG